MWPALATRQRPEKESGSISETAEKHEASVKSQDLTPFDCSISLF